MAELVIEIFEVIDINKNQDERRTGAFGAGELLTQNVIKSTSISQARERVQRGLLAKQFIHGL
jgi:hypothetical protein